MEENLRGLSIRLLLSKYKRIVRHAPMVSIASAESLDAYYTKVLLYENEIIRRTELSN